MKHKVNQKTKQRPNDARNGQLFGLYAIL